MILNNMIKHSLSASLLLGLGIVSQAAPVNLPELLEKSIAKHPQVKKSAKEVEANLHEFESVYSSYLPTVDLRLAYGKELKQSESVEGAGDFTRTLWREEAGLTLRQMLYDGGETSARLKRQSHLISRARHQFKDSRLDLATRLVNDYIEVLRAQKQVKIAETNVAAHQDILKLVTSRFDRKVGTKADKDQVEGRLANATAQLKRETYQLESAYARLQESSGSKSRELTEVTPVKSLPKKLGGALSLMESTHPSLKASVSTVAAADAAIGEAEARFYPRFDLEVGIREDNNIGGTIGNDDQVIGMVVMNYNIFRGFQDRHNTLLQMVNSEQRREELSELKLQLKRDLALAWNARESKRIELNYFKTYTLSVESTVKAYQKQYNLGERTLFDLLNSRSEFFRAQATVTDTYYALLLGEYQLLSSIGNLENEVAKQAAPKKIEAKKPAKEIKKK